MQTLGFMGFGQAVTVTPSDTTQVTCRAIYVGGAGNVAVKTAPGATAVTFTAPPVGTILPVCIEGGQIMNTGTSASALVALS
jgi:hypothetical protein